MPDSNIPKPRLLLRTELLLTVSSIQNASIRGIVISLRNTLIYLGFRWVYNTNLFSNSNCNVYIRDTGCFVDNGVQVRIEYSYDIKTLIGALVLWECIKVVTPANNQEEPKDQYEF